MPETIKEVIQWMTHFAEIYKDRKGEWRWRMISKRNKKIVADSGEGYASKSSAKRGVLRAWERL